jgi:hypothetical protein
VRVKNLTYQARLLLDVCESNMFKLPLPARAQGYWAIPKGGFWFGRLLVNGFMFQQ